MAEAPAAIDELLARREVKKAEVLINRWLRGDPPPRERAAAFVYRARARLLTARCDDALDDLRSAQAIAPDLLESPANLELRADIHFARFELATVGFADRADAEQARALYERILTEFPDYENRGWVLYQRSRVLLTDNHQPHIEEAVAGLQRALLHPSHVPALTAYCYERLGFIAFYEMRNSGEALAFLDKAIATYPAGEDRLWLVHVHTLRSRILRQNRNYEEARAAAETAINIASAVGADGRGSLADALLTAGETLSHLAGRERDVLTYLTQFLQISKKPLGVDVTWSRAHEMLADAYLKTKQYQAAVNAYQAALQFNPYHPWEQSIYYRMARAFYHLGEFDKTLEALRRMMTAAETDGEIVNDYRAYNLLGNALFALRQYDQAEQAYAEALRLAPPSSDQLESIRQYLQMSSELKRSNPLAR